LANCHYTRIYRDHDTGKDERYKCPYEEHSKGLCKFHLTEYAKDEKNLELLNELLREEVEKANASGSPLKWIGYQIPPRLAMPSEFKVDVYLNFASFLGNTSFESSNFQRNAYFSDARFNGEVSFGNVHFNGKEANFSRVNFNGKVYFTGAHFNGKVYFTGAHFYEASFLSVHFNGEAIFSDAQFNGEAIFSDAQFNGEAYLDASYFYVKADFSRVQFREGATVYFSGAQFNGKAIFTRAQFNGKAIFTRAQFNVEEANFSRVNFSRKADFSNASFKHAKFFDVDFKEEVEFFNVEFPSTDRKYLFDWDHIMTREGRYTLFEFLKQYNILRQNLSIENSRALKTEADKYNKTISISCQEDRRSSSPSLHYIFVLDAEKSCAILKPASNSNDNRNKKNYEFIARTKKDDKLVEIYDKNIIHIPIIFHHSTFRKRTRFAGENDKNLELGFVSFVGVDMTNFEFSNVRWKTKKEKLLKIKDLITRNVIIDEEHLDRNNNYEEVSRIYNQLRKNYETRLLFSNASHFFTGEMEAIRKSLLGEKSRSLKSIPYLIYKWLALYGESISLPLAIWTPILIVVFIAARQALGACAVGDACSVFDRVIDSIAAYFQVPRSSAISSVVAYNLDIIERIVSAPVLGTAFIAVRRKFERLK
jgi:uncharacterized protein YjbI with pentapeptide repeats